ncbi:MAG: HDOD domain-containing protein, partial [Desulfobulbus sp.]|nr:HDOD domain-containing protein [Desulfobulbus sp.]
LKLINSAYYSLVNKVTSLTRAIIMLGLNTVKNLALSTAVIRCVGQAKKSKALPIKNFWAHSIGVGVMAKLLAAERGLPLAEREEYFVAGLLHDLGKIPFGDEYIEVLTQAKKEQMPLIHLEKLYLEIDHEEVGEMIASTWKLNPVITDAIRHHHSPGLAEPEHQALVATVALADFYICLFDIGYAGNRYPDGEQLTMLLAMCGLEWSTVSSLSGFVEEEIKKAEIFLRV